MKTSTAKVALVTGAAGGIGLSIAQHLHSMGILVAMVDIKLEVQEQAAKISAYAYQADISKSEEVRRVISAVQEELGDPLILVNCAGVGGPFHRAEDVQESEWDWIMNVNLKAVFLFTSLLLPAMKSSGFGRIINIASIQGLFGSARSSTYVASKHGMIGYTKTIAAEAGSFGVTCNAICPGYVETGMVTQDRKIDQYTQRVLARSPVKRISLPSEIARVVLHLIDDEAGFINGSSIVVDGGLSAHLGIT